MWSTKARSMLSFLICLVQSNVVIPGERVAAHGSDRSARAKSKIASARSKAKVCASGRSIGHFSSSTGTTCVQ